MSAEFPIRRMIAVSVMFAGLILPAVYAAFANVGRGPGQILYSVALLVLAAWLTYNVLLLWTGVSWAWMPAVATFGTGFFLCVYPILQACENGDFSRVAILGAAASHFLLGLIALLSLGGKWMNDLEWMPAKDPLATSDKPALLARFRARRRK